VSEMMTQVNADRTFNLQLRSTQLQRAFDVADEATKQRIIAEENAIAEEKERIEKVETAVRDAVDTGLVTREDLAAFGDPNISDEQKLSMAQGIVGRAAAEDRSLDVEEREASIRASNALANERYYNSLIDRAGAGDEAAISELGLATEESSNVGIYGEMEATVGGKPLPAQAVVSLEKAVTVANQLNTLSGLFQDDKQLGDWS